MGCRWCLRSLEPTIPGAGLDLGGEIGGHGGDGRDGGSAEAQGADRADRAEQAEQTEQTEQARAQVVRCAGCDWAAYCSAECRVAEWSMVGGHQDFCDKRR